MNLNVGCGDPSALPQLAQGWVWFDMNGWPVHVRGDALALPFRDGTFAAVHCSHLVEHVARSDALRLVRELHRVLARGGYAYISTPDADRTRAIESRYWLSLTRHGGPGRGGWEHRWMPTVRSLRALLVEAGFVPTWATGIPTGHPPNSHHWPVDLEARFVCRRADFTWPQRYPSGVGHVR